MNNKEYKDLLKINDDDRLNRFLVHFKNKEERLDQYMDLLRLQGEASATSRLSKKALRRIAITLTTYCNLQCVWCHRKEKHVADYLHHHMPFDKAKKIISQCSGFELIHFGGLGEPLLYPQLFEAIALARQYVPGVKITTNGVLLTEDACLKLKEAGLTICEISLDGFEGDINERYRGVSHDVVLNNIRLLSDLTDIPIQINTVVSKQNALALYPAVDKIAGIKNIKMLHSIPLFMTESMLEKDIQEIVDDDFFLLLAHWKKRIEDLGLPLQIWPDTTEVDLDPVRTLKRLRNICFTVYEDPFINVYGQLSPCGRLQQISLGDVVEDGLDSVWNGDKMTAWRRSFLTGKCSPHCQRECHLKKS